MNDPPPQRNIFINDSNDSDIQVDHFGQPVMVRTRSQTSSVSSVGSVQNSTVLNLFKILYKVLSKETLFNPQQMTILVFCYFTTNYFLFFFIFHFTNKKCLNNDNVLILLQQSLFYSYKLAVHIFSFIIVAVVIIATL